MLLFRRDDAVRGFALQPNSSLYFLSKYISSKMFRMLVKDVKFLCTILTARNHIEFKKGFFMISFKIVLDILITNSQHDFKLSLLFVRLNILKGIWCIKTIAYTD